MEQRQPARSYDVEHYIIRTSFDPANKSIRGETTVELKPLAPGFQAFELDAAGMTFESVTLEPGGRELRWTQPKDRISITLDRPYSPSESIAVRLRYTASPRKGLYFVDALPASRYRPFARPAQIWTQGEPEENHHWFPCYDFPDDKATSEQYITTAANEIAISNGELLETLTNPDGTRTFHWKMDQPHSSYLISLVVGNYSKLSDRYKNIPVDYYTYPGTETKARNAFGRTTQMMEWFSQRLQYDFPYNKYAQTVVDTFIFGGMENITATTQADTEILSGEGNDASLSVDNLVAHELAHSWFGNLATCKDWANLWVNEGFATFFEAAYKEHASGRNDYLLEMRANASNYIFEDSSQYRRPVISYRYMNPIDLFDSTLYKKGGVVVHMLREVVGEEVFWKALNAYLNEYKYRNTDARDVQRTFERIYGKPLDWFFDQWLYKAGHPELKVRHSYNAQTRQLTLDVEQTQVPDALTPAVFRLPGVEVEIGTTHGRKTERIDITKRSESYTFKLDGRPRTVVFDKGERVLKSLDYPQSPEMTVYKLRESEDAMARTDAARSLSGMSGSLSEAEKRRIIRALRLALSGDSFYGVRLEAAQALARFKSADALNALIEGTKDVDARVRTASLAGLQNINPVEEARNSALGLLFSIIYPQKGEEEQEAA